MGLHLWLPPSPTTVEYRCGCGAEFVHKEAGIRHAIQCVKKHADEIAEMAELRDSSALGGPLDKEKDRWAHQRMKEGKRAYNGRGDVA